MKYHFLMALLSVLAAALTSCQSTGRSLRDKERASNRAYEDSADRFHNQSLPVRCSGTTRGSYDDCPRP